MVEVEWGSAGIEALSERADAIVIVDVLSFSSSGDVAVSRGGAVLPCPGKNLRASDYRACLDAVYDWADYVTVNLSSPNTPGMRTRQAASAAHLAPRLAA